jgi:hypothetical protein
MTSDPYLGEYFYGIWMVMFWLSLFSFGNLVYNLLQMIWTVHMNQSTSSVPFRDTGLDQRGWTDVVNDMRTMMEEISELSLEERRERSEKYYILTNLLVNRFRIEVYEKILK